ncbi:allergen Asp F4-like protein [Cordyceps militaris CM01]|uniref:Allergen Asp F4-like protein n=2 Tax=Cordyceps militaris TaxID=73501 RepID=G3JGW2_CORMM|nr:allergen Asp F4-like protein [Cordyceps militaris CM01]ATY59288.1 allergen Asp F4 [Cordyceps militaris]EGX91518.1 allergen Asp F4-like protein [Cordyceps militaris CM01]
MKFSAAVVLAAAMGASAHPSHHAHRNAHRSVVGREFVMAKKPAPPAPTTVAPSAPAPTTVTPATISVASVAPASPSADAGSGYKPFCNGNKKRATLAQIAYSGNTGAPGNYGCNIMEVSASAASSYDYTMKFVNAGSSAQACVCWNKIGPDGGINGFFKNNQAIDFNLPVGGETYVAVEGNSQIGCSCGSGAVDLTSFGQFAGTWVEADFANESNNKWSGFDASALVPAKFGLKIPGMSVCGQGVCSDIYPGGAGKNAYLGGMEAADGIGGNIKPGPLALTVKVNTN